MKSCFRKKRTQAQISVATGGDDAPVANEVLGVVLKITEVLCWVKQSFLVSTKLMVKLSALLAVPRGFRPYIKVRSL